MNKTSNNGWPASLAAPTIAPPQTPRPVTLRWHLLNAAGELGACETIQKVLPRLPADARSLIEAQLGEVEHAVSIRLRNLLV